MRMPIATKKSLIARAKDMLASYDGSQRDGCGISSTFIKLCDSWGVKFSMNGAKYMSKTYKRQRRASKFELGPYCFGLFKTTVKIKNIFRGEVTYREKTVYGYITQIVDIVKNVFGMFLADEIPEIFTEEIDNLIQQIKELIGFRFWDCHAENLGYIDGKLVCIDWGDENNMFEE